jgi:two-component system chemotaxis response regulator CheB
MVPQALTHCRAAVIGASAGAMRALERMLPAIGKNPRIPVLVVVHVLPQRPSLLVDLLAPKCACPVQEVEDKVPVTPGVWLAAPDYHLLVEKDETSSLSQDDPVRFARPSIDVLFESAADVWGPTLAAFVLTGGNDDGAAGAARVRAVGGAVYVQDPAEAEMPAMPKAALLATSPTLVAPLGELTRILVSLTG